MSQSLRVTCARTWRAWHGTAPRALTGCAVLCAVAVTVCLAPAPAAGQVRPHPGRPVRGVDVSAFQHASGPVNWRRLARDGMRFAAIKVSEGTYYTNPYYSGDARTAAAAGLSVMPYVFANPHRSGGAAQARFGVRAARYRRGRGGLPFGVDLENDPYTATDHTGDCYGLRQRRMVAWISAFVAETVALTGKRPIIYTTADWWRECTGDTGRFRRDPLWVAAYDTRVPGVPWPWTQWTFWQYTDNAWVPGVGITDVDYFHPTPALPGLRHPRAKPHGAKHAPVHKTPAPRSSWQPPIRTWWVPPYLETS
jgi:GH25 family lysozyme M1 (1,4-beta-N-acetylmuramidase)